MHETPTSRRFLYESKAKGRLQPYLYLTAGGLCVAFAIAGMVFSVTRPAGQRVGPVEQYALVTMPVLFALAAFSYAAVLFRTPRRIELSIEGILLESPVKRLQIPWDQIDRAETDKKLAFIPGTEVEILVLRDARGAKLAVISSAIKDFVDLSTRVQRIVRKRTGHATVTAKSRRSKRTAAWFIAFATTMLALSVSAGFNGWKEWTSLEQLAKDGVETDATVTKHYLYNGRGPWVEYTFRDAKGRTFERRALLVLHEWQLLEGATTIAVRYVPSNPENNRVAAGEDSLSQHDPKSMVFLAPLLGLVSILFFVAGVLRWKRFDVTFDEKKLRFRLKRLDVPADGQFVDATDQLRTE
jgi:hypothetical protein